MIGLEKNCFSCSKTDNAKDIMKAFKIACLTYAPSKVAYDNITYTRENLLSVKQNLTEFCQTQLQHLDLDD